MCQFVLDPKQHLNVLQSVLCILVSLSQGRCHGATIGGGGVEFDSVNFPIHLKSILFLQRLYNVGIMLNVENIAGDRPPPPPRVSPPMIFPSRT